MNRDEVSRLAAMTHQLRPDWPWKSLKTFIETELYQRAYRDCAVALALVATDPDTRTPRRVLEAGPWWHVAPTGGATPARRPPPWTELCDDCSQPRELCERMSATGAVGAHPFNPKTPATHDGERVNTETGELTAPSTATRARRDWRAEVARVTNEKGIPA